MNSNTLATIENNRSSNLGRVQYFVYLTLIIYFVVPHHLFTLLLNLSEIKPFDLAVLIALSFYLICRINLKGYIPILILFSVYLLRSFIAIADVGLVGTVFALKFFEYFIVIFCIRDLRPVFVEKLVKIYIASIILYILAELIGINVGLLWGGRATAHFGGPYELSAIALLFFFFFSRNIFLRLLFVLIILLTATKAAYLALVFGLLLSVNFKNILYVSVAGLIFVYIINLYDERFLEFISTLSSISDMELVMVIWNSLPTIETHAQYMELWNMRQDDYDETIDLSSFSRLYTYAIILKSFDLSAVVYGNGPGFFGAAVDSSILRIFAETGIIGLIASFYVIFSLTNSFKYKYKNLILILGIVALSDVFFSARFLPTLALLNQYNRHKLKS
tara:strand:- start:1975 stop:3147 length:1173 start_codon:yes stop_codon:yes gene_type:complete